MNIFNQLRQDVIGAVSRIAEDFNINLDTQSITIETPKDPLNGDLSTNAAMVCTKAFKKNPREIAGIIKEGLQGLDYIAHIEIAGPGFLNFTINLSTWQQCIADILESGTKYGDSSMGEGQKINIEYVSANPTGPMHIGHARGAVYGDALSRLLAKCGYNVTKEYYVNDAGSQIDILAQSVFLRYKEQLTGQTQEITEGLYPGEYLIPLGKELVEQYGDSLIHKDISEILKPIKDFSVSRMLDLIRSDLADLGIKHDVFTYETELHRAGQIEKAIEKLNTKGLIYEGELDPPKGMPAKDWKPRKQLLFKSTDFGDDQDRPLKKHDQKWTYFAADIAYADHKIQRGFDSLVVILGADHGGYVKRMEAVIEAIGDSKVAKDIKICQLVNFMLKGEPIKMSKRAGSFTTVRDVIGEVGSDVIRFMMLTRKNDMIMDFDLEQVKEQSKENPIFYVQYAFVRAKSIIHNSKTQASNAYEMFIKNKYDLTILETEEEIRLIKLLASWPKMVESAALYYEPHRIAFFLQNVAATFHSLWNLGKENNDYRFIIEDNPNLTSARLALATAVMHIIHSGLKIIGIAPLDKM